MSAATSGGPPEKVNPPAALRGGHHNDSYRGQSSRFDVPAACRRRREAACRLPGGDPEARDTRYHRPTTGLYASGYRDGFSRGARDALRRVYRLVPAEHRGEVERIAAASGGGDE